MKTRAGRARKRKRLASCLSYVAIAAYVYSWTYKRHQTTTESSRTQTTGVRGDESACPLLTFETEGGFTNQVLDIIYVFTFAASLSVPSIIQAPQLLADGTQIASTSGGYETKNQQRYVPFDAFFDVDVYVQYFRRTLTRLVTRQDSLRERACVKTCLRTEPLQSCVELVVNRTHWPCKIVIEAPFLHRIWSSEFLLREKKTFDNLLALLQPSAEVRAAVLETKRGFEQASDKSCMTFVHARVEDDWKQHCAVWTPSYRSTYDYSCFVSFSEILLEVLRQQADDCGLFLAYDPVGAQDMKRLLQRTHLKFHTFDAFVLAGQNMPRELRAAIQYFLALDAEKFLGNTVSTLSALILRERRINNLWSAQYNRGPTPLAEFIPGYRLPWVFFGPGSNEQYIQMMKVAVLSALRRTTLIPHVVVTDDEEKSTIAWLQARDVIVIRHSIKWRNKLSSIIKSSTKQDISSSHLYVDANATFRTYARLDLALLAELKQYEHILYTDIDIFFRGEIDIIGQGHLTDTIQMGYEMQNIYPLNAGVFFASTRFLQETYDALMNELYSSTSLNYPGFGPGDQGLLNKVYEKQLLDSRPLAKHFNAKPYQVLNCADKIVHFHGPKPLDYIGFLVSHACRFKGMCAQGIERGACAHLAEWIRYTAGEDVHTLITDEMKEYLRKCENDSIMCTPRDVV